MVFDPEESSANAIHVPNDPSYGCARGKVRNGTPRVWNIELGNTDDLIRIDCVAEFSDSLPNKKPWINLQGLFVWMFSLL